MTQDTVQFSLSEAVLLGHALVSHIAERSQVRHLLIKGPTLERLQLRAPRVSSDVDALLEPRGLDIVRTELLARGWVERPLPRVARIMPGHSVTLVHEAWPCDIDLHWRFPGFLATDIEVFEALWVRRQMMEFAGVMCPIPDKAGSTLILALHSLRSTANIARHQTELITLVANSTAQTESDRVALSDLAQATGCVETLSGYLEPLGVPAPNPDGEERQEVTAWRMQVASGAVGTQLWLNALRALPLLDRLRVIPRVLWPSESDFKILHPDAGDSHAELRIARLKRILRGARELPRLLTLRRRIVSKPRFTSGKFFRTQTHSEEGPISGAATPKR